MAKKAAPKAAEQGGPRPDQGRRPRPRRPKAATKAEIYGATRREDRPGQEGGRRASSTRMSELIAKELGKKGPGLFVDPRPAQAQGRPQARHQGQAGHQPLHQGADDDQGEARPQRRQGRPDEGPQGTRSEPTHERTKKRKSTRLRAALVRDAHALDEREWSRRSCAADRAGVPDLRAVLHTPPPSPPAETSAGWLGLALAVHGRRLPGRPRRGRRGIRGGAAEVGVELVDERDAVGMFRPTISSSETLSRYLTIARMLLPCAATTTLVPDLTAGASVSCQKGGSGRPCP